MPSKQVQPVMTHGVVQNGAILPLICPGCGREGHFQPIGQDVILHVSGSGIAYVVHAGNRLCPSPNCRTHVFVLYELMSGGARPIRSYPVGRIAFDTTSVPVKVTNAFDEALTCAANECYIAAGMLLRKTLEAVCEDRKAIGDNLFKRIADLRTKIILSQDLFDAMDHLRLLGNDAAHVEAKTYDDVGKDEVQTAIELTKEIIKATYQHKDLVAKLIALKKPPSP